MELYKLPQSVTVAAQDNKIPPFGLKVVFANGAFADHCYAPSNLNALWTIIGGSFSLESEIFFEIEREDYDFKLQGYGNESGFCVFQDTYHDNIKILGCPPIAVENIELLQIFDARWGLTYFLPKSGFIDFFDMIKIVNISLQDGALSDFVEFSQLFRDLGLPDGFC